MDLANEQNQYSGVRKTEQNSDKNKENEEEEYTQIYVVRQSAYIHGTMAQTIHYVI